MFEKTKDKLRKGEKIVFVAFGDSITEGYGVNEGWPEKAVRELKGRYPQSLIELFNKGRAGDTIEDGLFRLDSDVISLRPDLLTVNFGINDAVSGVGLQRFEDCTRELAGVVRTKLEDCELVVLSSEVLEDEDADRLCRKYYDKLQKVCRESKTAFLDMHRIWHQKLREGAELSRLLIPGLDHPNEEGYRIFARAFAELFF